MVQGLGLSAYGLGPRVYGIWFRSKEGGKGY